MKALLTSESNSWDVSYGHSARKVLELLGGTDNHHFTEKRRRQAENKYLIIQKNH